MAVENKDVIRVHDTIANLTANLKEKMFGYDTENDRFSTKIAGGSMKNVSDDTQQVLIAGTQTITGLKTFSQNIIMTASKLLTLDQVGGLRMVTGSINTISPDGGADFSNTELWQIQNGLLQVIDKNFIGNQDVITEGLFITAPGTVWAITAGFTFGSARLVFAHSDGTDDARQLTVDMTLPIPNPGQFYEMKYTILSLTGTPIAELDVSDTVNSTVAVDLAVGTDKILFFQWASSFISFKINVISTAGDAFEITNIRVKPVEGHIKATTLGPLGTELKISGSGDVNANGFYGGSDNSQKQVGLKFDSLGNPEFTEGLKIGTGSPKDDQNVLNPIIDIQEPLTGRTINVANVFFNFGGTSNNRANVIRVTIVGANSGGTKGYFEVVSVAIRDNGSTLEFIGEVGDVVDEFSGIVTTFTNVSDTLQLKITGVASETIDWYVQATKMGV